LDRKDDILDNNDAANYENNDEEIEFEEAYRNDEMKEI